VSLVFGTPFWRAITWKSDKPGRTTRVGTLEKELVIVNRLGLHLRAAAQFVRVAQRFSCDVFVRKGETVINGKSIMGLAMLAAARGTRIVVITDGEDAKEALSALTELVESGFGEE